VSQQIETMVAKTAQQPAGFWGQLGISGSNAPFLWRASWKKVNKRPEMTGRELKK
jgi:hypothetical protein